MKLIILDRDGVINVDSDDYIKTPDEWIPIPGSLQAIARLNAAGYKVAIATNQSGIARGYYDIATLNAMHEKMSHLLALENGVIDNIAYCPHGPDDHCNCRKPLPGLLLNLAESCSANLSDCFFVGDSASDLHAADNAGCKFALVKTGKGLRTINTLSEDDLKNIPVFENLAGFVSWLLDSKNSRS